MYPDGSFSHEHPNPMELEFARDVEGALPEDTPKTDYLEVASDLMKGDGSIELFQMYREKYIESEDTLSNEDVLSTGNQIIDKHIEAFKNLADGEK